MKTQMIRKHTSITYYSDFSKHLLHLLRICNSQDSNHLQTEQMGAGGADDSYKSLYYGKEERHFTIPILPPRIRGEVEKRLAYSQEQPKWSSLR